MHYFIDGYNLLFYQFSQFSTLERARAELILELNEISLLLKCEITVIFDAGGQTQESSTFQKADHINIIYTGAHQTADEYLSHWAQTRLKKDKANYTVVSNDKAVVRQMRCCGLKTLSVSSFLVKKTKKLKKQEKQTKSALVSKKRDPIKTVETSLKLSEMCRFKPISDPQLEYYLKAFEKNVPPKKIVDSTEPPETEMQRWLRLFES